MEVINLVLNSINNIRFILVLNELQWNYENSTI